MMERREAIKKYEAAKSRGEVDADIISLLDLINYETEFYTTSSCSGRIGVISLPEIGDKLNSRFICKFHREVDFEEISRCLENADGKLIMLLLQSPIIHVVAPDVEMGSEMIRMALKCGFKNTCMKSIGRGMLIEILSTENLSVPVGEDGEIYISDTLLKLVVKTANDMLRRAKKKLECLEREIRYSLPS